MKSLVTGGAGFVGSHLTDLLIEKGHQVVVLDNLSTGKKSQVNKKARFVKASILNFDKIRSHFKKVDFVFHLAGQARVQPSIKDPARTFENNVMGTLNVLLASRDNNVKRVIYPTSSTVYGDQEISFLKERLQPNFKSPYALSKYMGEELCRLFSNLYGLETVCLRCFSIYGSRQTVGGSYASVIGVFLDQLRRGQPLTIVGNGQASRDFIHVFDVARANLLAAVSKKVGRGEIINIGTSKDYSVNQIAALILSHYQGNNLANQKISAYNRSVNYDSKLRAILSRAVKEKKVVYLKSKKGEAEKTLADISLAKELLSWRPSVSLEQSIPSLLEEII